MGGTVHPHRVDALDRLAAPRPGGVADVLAVAVPGHAVVGQLGLETAADGVAHDVRIAHPGGPQAGDGGQVAVRPEGLQPGIRPTLIDQVGQGQLELGGGHREGAMGGRDGDQGRREGGDEQGRQPAAGHAAAQGDSHAIGDPRRVGGSTSAVPTLPQVGRLVQRPVVRCGAVWCGRAPLSRGRPRPRSGPAPDPGWPPRRRAGRPVRGPSRCRPRTGSRGGSRWSR